MMGWSMHGQKQVFGYQLLVEIQQEAQVLNNQTTQWWVARPISMDLLQQAPHRRLALFSSQTVARVAPSLGGITRTPVRVLVCVMICSVTLRGHC